MGIFYKDCPHCATTHAASTDTCACGYMFNGKKLEEPHQVPEIVAQEEKLYAAYLAARLEQAAKEAEQAEIAVHTSHRSPLSIAQAEKATKALALAQANYDAQTAKTAEAIKMAEIAKTTLAIKHKSIDAERIQRQAEQAQHEAEKIKRIEEEQIQAENIRRAEEAKVQAEQSRQAEAARIQAENMRKAEQAKLHSEQLHQANQARRMAEKIKRTEEACVLTEQARRTEATRLEADKAKQAEHAAARTYLAAQTAKAEQALKTIQAGKINEQALAQGGGFKAAQAARAERIMLGPKECPNCTGMVAHNDNQCGCGYTFGLGENELPGLSLSPVEKNELFSFILNPLNPQ